MTVPVTRRALESPRNQAEAIASGLDAEVITSADAIAWASEIERLAHVPDSQLNSILRTAADAAAAIRALRALPGDVDRSAVDAILVGWLLRLRHSDPTRAETMLAKLALSYRIHGLRGAAEDYYGRKALADYRGTTIQPRELELSLVKACADYVESAVGPLEWLDSLPPWVRAKQEV